MKCEVDDIWQAVRAMKELIPFFPTDGKALAAIVILLDKMISTKEQLEWLLYASCNEMRKWEGFVSLRALYCTRYRPADGGSEPECTLPGFTPQDCEEDYHRRYQEETNRRILEWRKEQKLLAGETDPTLATIDSQTPCPACGSQKWTAVVKEGFLFARCEQNHEIAFELVRDARLMQFVQHETKRAKPQSLFDGSLDHISKAPVMTPEEKQKKVDALEAAIRMRHPDVKL